MSCTKEEREEREKHKFLFLCFCFFHDWRQCVSMCMCMCVYLCVLRAGAKAAFLQTGVPKEERRGERIESLSCCRRSFAACTRLRVRRGALSVRKFSQQTSHSLELVFPSPPSFCRSPHPHTLHFSSPYHRLPSSSLCMLYACCCWLFVRPSTHAACILTLVVHRLLLMIAIAAHITSPT